MNFGKVLKAWYRISPVIPSSPGALLLFVLSTAFLISSVVNSRSSCVSGGCKIVDLTILWYSLSSRSCLRGEVTHHQTQGFFCAISESSVRFLQLLSQCWHFSSPQQVCIVHGLVAVVMLQYSFQGLIFSLFIVAENVALLSRYCFFRIPLSSSLFFVLWQSLRRAFVLFLSTVSSVLHQGTVLCVDVFFVVLYLLKDILHAVIRASLKSSIHFLYPCLYLVVSRVNRPGLPHWCHCVLFGKLTSLSCRRFLEIY